MVIRSAYNDRINLSIFLVDHFSIVVVSPSLSKYGSRFFFAGALSPRDAIKVDIINMQDIIEEKGVEIPINTLDQLFFSRISCFYLYSGYLAWNYFK